MPIILSLKIQPRYVHSLHKHLATHCVGWRWQEKMAKDNKVLWLDSIRQSIILKHHLYSSPQWCYGCSNMNMTESLPLRCLCSYSDTENNQEWCTILWKLMTPQYEQHLACCSNQKCLLYQNWVLFQATFPNILLPMCSPVQWNKIRVFRWVSWV